MYGQKVVLCAQISTIFFLYTTRRTRLNLTYPNVFCLFHIVASLASLRYVINGFQRCELASEPDNYIVCLVTHQTSYLLVSSYALGYYFAGALIYL